jgi:transposase-like protein
MRRSRFSADEKARILALEASGLSVATICARTGISAATYFRWKRDQRIDLQQAFSMIEQLQGRLYQLERELASRTTELEALRSVIEGKD